MTTQNSKYARHIFRKSKKHGERIVNLRFMKDDLSVLVRTAMRIARTSGREICGFLVYNGYFIELVRMRNKTRRCGGFTFYRADVRMVCKAVRVLGHRIVGTFHSHPFYIAKPGSTDKRFALDNDLMLIIDADEGKTGLWWISRGRMSKKRIQTI